MFDSTDNIVGAVCDTQVPSGLRSILDANNGIRQDGFGSGVPTGLKNILLNQVKLFEEYNA